MASLPDDTEIDSDEMDLVNALTSCPICMDQFTVPKVLPCQHTFCLDCLRAHYQATNAMRAIGPISNFPCPTCRRNCNVPRDGLHELPTDFKVEQIHDLLRAVRSSKLIATSTTSLPTERPQSMFSNTSPPTSAGPYDAEPTCAVCRYQGISTKKAANFCVQCGKHFCSPCSNNHRKNSLFKEHSVVSIAPTSTESISGWVCEVHKSEMAYFCTQCSLPACMLCVTCSHDGHAVTSPKDAIEQVRIKLRCMSDELLLKSKEIDKKGETTRRLKQDHAKALEETTKIVKAAAAEAERKIREVEKQALMELRTSSEERNQALVAAEKSFQGQQKSTRALSAKLIDLMSCPNLRKTLTEFSALETRAHTELSLACEISIALGESVSYIQDVQIKLGASEKRFFPVEEPRIQSPKGAAANLSATKTTPTSFGAKIMRMSFRKAKSEDKNGQPLPPPIIHLSPAKHDIDMEPPPRSPVIEALRSQADTNQRGDLVVRLQRRLSSIHDRLPFHPPPPVPQAQRMQSVAYVDDDFSARSLWKFTDFSRCRDVCFAAGDQIAATDFNSTAIRDAQGRSRIKIFGPSSVGNNRWQLLRSVESVLIGEPWCLCYNPATASLFVTDHGSNSSIKSVKVNSVKDVSMWKGPSMERASGIALMRSGDLVISETGKRTQKKIGVYSMSSGRLSRTKEFGVRGDGEGEVLMVNYVAVDSQDRIIISDCENHTIKVFSATGEELLKFSASSADDVDMVPQGLAVDERNNIFVADQTARGILKFSSEGLQIGDTLRTAARPWGISYCAERQRLAVASDKGLEVFEILT